LTPPPSNTRSAVFTPTPDARIRPVGWEER
jgi:hypothetical protein